MKDTHRPEAQPPCPEDFDAAVNERDQEGTRSAYSIGSQIILTVKLLAGVGVLGSAIWLIDEMVGG